MTTPAFKLTAFDILDRASSEISHLAASVGIDFSLLLPLLGAEKSEHEKGIALDKSHKGKVKAWFEVKTAKSGQEFPILRFNTVKEGGYSEVFNGWQWLLENHLVGVAAPLSDAEKTAIEQARAAREQRNAHNAERHANTQALTQAQSIKRFEDFSAVFEFLPTLTDTVGTYLGKKGFALADLPADFVIKRGKDFRGGFIAYALKNEWHKVVGFQKIYDAKFMDQDGNSRDKDFVFYSESKKGSYALLGTPKNTRAKIFCAEGLATALTVYVATGKPCVICLDADNLFHVVKHLSGRFKSITLAADNDCKPAGNAGIYSALITAKAFHCDIVFPKINDAKCDFDDVRLQVDIKEAKRQLRVNKLDFSDPAVYYKLLIKTVASNRKDALQKYVKSACFMIANSLLLSDDETIKASGVELQAIIDDRKLMLNDAPINAAGFIGYFLNRKIVEIKKANSLVDIPVCATVHDCTGMTNADIVTLMQQFKRSIWLDTRPMGTGKTELMQMIVGIVKQYGQENSVYRQVTYIAHRVALIKDASNRLSLDYYEDISWSSGERTEHLATTVNGIVNHAVSRTVNVLFIDEIRQTLEHLLNGTCDNRQAVWLEFVRAIENADMVLCADADLNQFTLDTLVSFANKPIHIIQVEAQKTGKTIVELASNEALFAHAKQALLRGESIWISTDSKSKAENMEEFLACINEENNNAGVGLGGLLADKALKLTADDILLITSENKADDRQAELAVDYNEMSKKYRVVIHTPVISSGVSITNGHFTNVYAIFCNVVAPNEMMQTVARVRTAQEIFCTFKTGFSKNRPVHLQDLIDGETIKRGRFIAKDGTLALDEFDMLRLNQIINKNKALNDFKPYFLLLAQAKGYDVCLYNAELEQGETALPLDADLKIISKRVKDKTILSIIDAEKIDKEEAERIEKLNATTQQQANAAKRYTVSALTGKSGFDSEAITPEDVDFITFNRGASIIKNHELLSANIVFLMEADKANHECRDKLSSKTSKHLLFKAIIDDINGLPNATFSSDQAAVICQNLQRNHQELTANELGNYKHVSRHPVKQLTAFLARLGFDVAQVDRDNDGQRFYAMTVNERVKGYVEARAKQREFAACAELD